MPPGCPVTADINLAFKEALMPGQSTPDTIVIFPSQDSYVGGGIYSGKLLFGVVIDMIDHLCFALNKCMLFS